MNLYQMKRGWMKHELFKSKKPYSRREAWLSLIEHASWSDRRKMVGRRMELIKRGQLAHAHNFLAEEWTWHRSKVGRFLKELEREAMIKTSNEMDWLLVTICNYAKYQLKPGFRKTNDETQNKNAAEQARDSDGTNKNTREIPFNPCVNTLGDKDNVESRQMMQEDKETKATDKDAGLPNDRMIRQEWPSKIDRQIIPLLKSYYKFNDHFIKRYFEPCEFDLSERRIIAPSRMHADYIRNNCESGLHYVFGHHMEVISQKS